MTQNLFQVTLKITTKVILTYLVATFLCQSTISNSLFCTPGTKNNLLLNFFNAAIPCGLCVFCAFLLFLLFLWRFGTGSLLINLLAPDFF